MNKLKRYNGLEKPPIKIVQFGEGNFLRAFVNYAFQQLNDQVAFNGGIAVVQPINNGMVELLNKQDGLYTLFLRGIENGKTIDEKHLISNIVKGINPYENFQQYLDLAKEEELKYIISNTTEAGIAYLKGDSFDAQPPQSFPAKLTRLLWERYNHYKGASNKGLKIIPCELINHNADQLKKHIYQYCNDWNLGEEFKFWIENHNSFHNTLVDRIVPGYPRNEIDFYRSQMDYEDQLIVVAESFFLWVIEDNGSLKSSLNFDHTNCDVKFVDSFNPIEIERLEF
jgi:tagaturonate reductase